MYDSVPSLYLTLDDMVHYCDGVLSDYGEPITWTESFLIELFDDCCIEGTRHSLHYSALDLQLNLPTEVLDDVIWTLLSGCHAILDRMIPSKFRYKVPSIVYNLGGYKFKFIYGGA